MFRLDRGAFYLRHKNIEIAYNHDNWIYLICVFLLYFFFTYSYLLSILLLYHIYTYNSYCTSSFSYILIGFHPLLIFYLFIGSFLPSAVLSSVSRISYKSSVCFFRGNTNLLEERKLNFSKRTAWCHEWLFQCNNHHSYKKWNTIYSNKRMMFVWVSFPTAKNIHRTYMSEIFLWGWTKTGPNAFEAQIFLFW